MLIYVKFIETHLFYAVFWRIAENRLQNDWFYTVFWSNGKVMVVSWCVLEAPIRPDCYLQ